jgi:hypothetical protein
MISTERKWATRAYRDGDEEEIFGLWKAVYPSHPYNREQWMRWWRWMYRANPSGMGVICLAEHDGKIIGQVAEVPMMLKIGSERVLVSLGIDAMTHPEYRRHGVLAEVAKVRHAEDEKHGVRATYSFPNKLSYAATIKGGLAFDIATMQKIVRPLNWQNALRTRTNNRLSLTSGAVAGDLLGPVFFRAGKAPVLEGLTVTRVSCFDERIDDLWRRASDQYQVLVLRNKEYLNWRYAAAPERDYLIYVAERSEAVVGYLVLSRKQADQAKIGVIIDVFAESEEVTQCLISEASERCKQEKLDLIYGARIAGTSLARAYRRNGFVPVPFAEDIRVIGFSFSPNITEQLRNPKNWFLQIGDSDEA